MVLGKGWLVGLVVHAQPSLSPSPRLAFIRELPHPGLHRTQPVREYRSPAALAQLGYPKGHPHFRMPRGIGWFLRQLRHGSAPLCPTLPTSLLNRSVSPEHSNARPPPVPPRMDVSDIGFLCWRPTMLHLYTCVHARSLHSSPTLRPHGL